MPRTWDRRHPSNDKDPTNNKLDYDNPGGVIDEGAEKAGDPIHQFFSGLGKLFNLPTPQDFLTGVANGVETLWNGLTYFAKLLGGFLDPTQVPILDPSKILNLPLIIGNVRGLLTGIVKAFTGDDGDPDNYIDPVNHLTYAAETLSGNTQAIEELKAANNGQETGGISGGDNFQTPVTGGPPPGWIARSSNGITTYVDTSTGKAEWHNAGNANPLVRWQRNGTDDANTLGEYQKVTETFTTPLGGTNSRIGVECRVSDDGAHYVTAYLIGSTIFIAYAAGGAETVVDSGPIPVGVDITSSTVLSIEPGTGEDRDEYRVRINDANAQSWTDDTNLATTSVNYAARGLSTIPKGWGVNWKPGFAPGGIWKRPMSLSGCTIADNVPAEVQGHGFRVYREATTSSGGLSVGDELAPYYDEIDYISAGSAWSAAGYVIPKSGMWVFNYRMYRSSGTWTQCCVGLKVGGVSRVAGAFSQNLGITDGSFQFHCKKGDVVTPYIAIASGTVAMNGSSSGLDSYFSGSLGSS